ncbi:c-type cytochrome [Robertkochia aurantiaca]|uniref:c-type cytochrome n=1 Tax=Robertkochia aurantiaca TaxID=2873700 RepID=UPI001CCE54C0|nr:c-type cytochrome [Robertkochia sp. 3YJGBD-33]
MQEPFNIPDHINKLRRTLVVFTAAVMLLALFIFITSKNPSIIDFSSPEEGPWELKDPVTAFSSGEMPGEVKYGYMILTETSKWIGPDAHDTQMRFSGNHLSCTNCHLTQGTQAGSASWVGVPGRFPQFRGRENKEGTLQERINGCMERSMNGKAIPEGSREMGAMIAYMEWISEGLPPEMEANYKGFTDLKIPEVKVDLMAGKAVYDRECVICHGDDGQGIPSESGYQYPPLWGNDTYNNGAGMHRVLTAARFIKANMPFGIATKENPKLTDEEAYHVAGYINSFDRPEKPGLERDFPDLKLKPVSTPYGPWADEFSEEQHRWGPFLPIIEFYKKEYGITKTK